MTLRNMIIIISNFFFIRFLRKMHLMLKLILEKDK